MSLASVWSEIDLDGPGRRVGAFRVEHSVHLSAYGTIPVPVASFAHGTGPTVLLMAGSHGDEYEGQIALTRLIRALDPGRVQGHVLVVPAANLPAVLDGRRTSPLDQGNLNRSFGDHQADTPTGQIAAYLAEELFPRCDAVLDLHSGGSSFFHLSCAYADLGNDRETALRTFGALLAMNAPVSWAQPGIPNGPVAGRAALRKGALHLSGEFGGGGRLVQDDLYVAERCVHRLLDHLGVVEMEDKWRNPVDTRHVFNRQDHFIYAPTDGVFEPLVGLGTEVEPGQLAGYLHRPEFPLPPPEPLHFKIGGLVAAIRAPARSRAGDCLFQLLGDRSSEEILACINELPAR